MAALRHNKMVAPMVVEGAMTGEMFLAYVESQRKEWPDALRLPKANTATPETRVGRAGAKMQRWNGHTLWRLFDATLARVALYTSPAWRQTR